MDDVLLLPGGVLPAALAYPALIEALGDGVRAVSKDLEVYGGDALPEGYGLEMEVAGIARAADDAGFGRFHLAGYSGGGAASLAFPATVLYVLGGRSHPDYYGRQAQRLAATFGDFTLEVFPERHHFDPPHRTEPERLAELLRGHWARAG